MSLLKNEYAVFGMFAESTEQIMSTGSFEKTEFSEGTESTESAESTEYAYV